MARDAAGCAGVFAAPSFLAGTFAAGLAGMARLAAALTGALLAVAALAAGDLLAVAAFVAGAFVACDCFGGVVLAAALLAVGLAGACDFGFAAGGFAGTAALRAASFFAGVLPAAAVDLFAVAILPATFFAEALLAAFVPEPGFAAGRLARTDFAPGAALPAVAALPWGTFFAGAFVAGGFVPGSFDAATLPTVALPEAALLPANRVAAGFAAVPFLAGIEAVLAVGRAPPGCRAAALADPGFFAALVAAATLALPPAALVLAFSLAAAALALPTAASFLAAPVAAWRTRAPAPTAFAFARAAVSRNAEPIAAPSSATVARVRATTVCTRRAACLRALRTLPAALRAVACTAWPASTAALPTEVATAPAASATAPPISAAPSFNSCKGLPGSPEFPTSPCIAGSPSA
ncbi:MAG: hypothetical protein J0H15_11785 [Xanthomonadales bacterium]|nr:hypothetical protein [Xanthomonadales bacterium]